ncbi:MAG TPA: FtsX-like permease family protein, partial [Longimicrobiales bacterium]|nr:FtsX-like permease family protein [Longimicrobiales bacterium]
AGLLLLLACANVASLLLARGETRRGEFALRRALGAGRGRVMAGLLTESTVLATLGGALGVALAAVGTRALLALAPPGLPRLDNVGFDGRVAAFAVAATLVAGAVFGTVPALRASGARPGGTRGESGPGRDLGRSLSTLVMVQLALAVVMISGAALLSRSVGRMLQAESGIVAENRLTASLSIPTTRYGSLDEVVSFWDRAKAEIEGLPGVQGVGWIRQLPLRDELRREGMRRVADGPQGEALPVADQVVGPGYLDVAGVPLLEGRSFEPGDVAGAPNVALVNRTAAQAYWPDESPVGQAVKPLWQRDDHGPLTIVGVVGDVRHEGVREAPNPEVYVPYPQLADHEASWVRSGTFVLRTVGDPEAVVPALRDALAALDPAVPLEAVESWTEVARGAVASERFLASVVLFFALCALAMATLGTFGVISYSTARRTREIGVRVALGARRGRVVGEILGRASRIALAGVVLGGAASLLAAPVLERFLFGVSARDPLTLVAVPLTMTLVAILAAALPASRAARIEPVDALREE